MSTARDNLKAQRIAVAERAVASYYALRSPNATMLSWVMFRVGCTEREASDLIATVAERRRIADDRDDVA